MRFLALAFASCALAASAQGCQTSCTAIGCVNVVRIAVRDAQNASLSSFRGQIRIGAQTFAVDCTGTSSDAGTDASVGGLGTACDPATGSVRITLSETPDLSTVHATLTSGDGLQSVDQDVTLTDQTSQPNGPSCAPTCHDASGNLMMHVL